jgi:hypothetical protein
VAFLFGVLRIPASVLALEGVLYPRTDRPGTCCNQAFLGLPQFAIALARVKQVGGWVNNPRYIVVPKMVQLVEKLLRDGSVSKTISTASLMSFAVHWDEGCLFRMLQ